VIEKAVPALITAREVLDRFHAMMRSKDEARLDPWTAMAADTKLAAFAAFAAFAADVEADKDAVATPWSSDQVERKITASRPSSARCSDAPKSICSREGSGPRMSKVHGISVSPLFARRFTANVKTPEREVTRNPGGKTPAIKTAPSPSNDKPDLPVPEIERRFRLEQTGFPPRIFLCPHSEYSSNIYFKGAVASSHG